MIKKNSEETGKRQEGTKSIYFAKWSHFILWIIHYHTGISINSRFWSIFNVVHETKATNNETLLTNRCNKSAWVFNETPSFWLTFVWCPNLSSQTLSFPHFECSFWVISQFKNMQIAYWLNRRSAVKCLEQYHIWCLNMFSYGNIHLDPIIINEFLCMI